MLPSADTVEVCLCFYKANSDLAVIWAVGQKMWQRDFPGTYENLKKDWCDSLRPIMDAILGIIFFFGLRCITLILLALLVCIAVIASDSSLLLHTE